METRTPEQRRRIMQAVKQVPKPTQTDDQLASQPDNLMGRIASVQERARAITTEATLSEAELKAFMDEQWAENS
ncbi:hypothetical protein HCZ23_14820 [Celeribacter sp. HF31]|uniref:hypothetical protein n=1 Tax=Celeribacter sp. HF31 TaxID=2721558 RepID=UPI00142F7920|nr:hypothetical protein [Celeribacter sp. HF31]NIY80736.1 hypothetical protein [Celeribacter sp. HF31]